MPTVKVPVPKTVGVPRPWLKDTVIGLVFTGFFALGLVLVSKVRSNIDLTHILFGNVLGISLADIWQTLLISALVVAVLLVLRRDLLLFCFDPTHARSIGINTGKVTCRVVAFLLYMRNSRRMRSSGNVPLILETSYCLD